MGGRQELRPRTHLDTRVKLDSRSGVEEHSCVDEDVVVDLDVVSADKDDVRKDARRPDVDASQTEQPRSNTGGEEGAAGHAVQPCLS